MSRRIILALLILLPLAGCTKLLRQIGARDDEDTHDKNVRQAIDDLPEPAEVAWPKRVRAEGLQPSAVRTRPRATLGDSGLVLDQRGQVDIDKTVAALRDLRANTFAYTVVQSPDAWKQLPAFADAAAKENIDIWVYVLPWSESPEFGKIKLWCEPFRLDFVAWARETAKLSRDHPNIKGLLLDDFAANNTQDDRFTPAYVKKMRAAMARENKDCQLLTILYFQQRWGDFEQRFAGLIDGAVVCYPISQEQINSAAVYLAGGTPHGAALMDETGRKETKTTVMAAKVTVPPGGGTLRFLFDHNNVGRTEGDHAASVKINGKTVWSHKLTQVAHAETVEVPLSGEDKKSDKKKKKRDKDDDDEKGEVATVVFTIGGQPSDQAATFITRFDDIIVADAKGLPAAQPRWTLVSRNGEATSVQNVGGGAASAIPMYLMPATDPPQFVKRYGEVPDVPAGVGRSVELCLDNVRRGRAVGVVNFYTPKTGEKADDAGVFREVARAFGAMGRK